MMPLSAGGAEPFGNLFLNPRVLKTPPAFRFRFFPFGGRLFSMGEALKAETVVGEGRKVRLEVDTPDLPEGTRLSVTMEPVPSGASEKVPITSFFGKGKGLFDNAQEAVGFIRRERNAWDDPEKS